MFYLTEYPKVYSAYDVDLDILKKPIQWFRPFLTGIGQVLLYRLRIQQVEKTAAKTLLTTRVITMDNDTTIRVGVTTPSAKPRAVVLYLHTVCGDYTQQAHFGNMVYDDNIAFVSYTRSGNDASMIFSNFNFIGSINELKAVINYISSVYPGVEIHAVGASAGSALLIRYLGKYNKAKEIKSAVLVSPGYSFMRSIQKMNGLTKAYLVNKMKYTIRHLYKDEIEHIRTMEDWVEFQSKMLGYKSSKEYIREYDPVYYLDKINVPSLFISSLDDGIFT